MNEHFDMKPTISKHSYFGSSVGDATLEGNLQFLEKDFVTGSSYYGQWDDVEMWGEGMYKFPHGNTYVGSFRGGEFHGNGTLNYPGGQALRGNWIDGNLQSLTYQFKDGLIFDSSWNYCKYPDRRFHLSKKGLHPAGFELLTNSRETRKIPKGCYDVCEGFYNPETGCIQSSEDEHSIIRIPTAEEVEWIKLNCRKEWDEPTGYRPDLYEVWHTDWLSVFGPRLDSDYNKDTIELEYAHKQFPTNSSYNGQWNMLGMTGHGEYVYPHGAIYKGGFTDGRFDNEGSIEYPKGQSVCGKWHLGCLDSWVYHFADGLKFDQSWRYCKYPDRRFNISIEEGLRAAGLELRTNSLVPREIPKGCYDTGEGFYNPEKRCIQSTYDENVILRIPNSDEEKWIIENCRKERDECIGYRPDLYPHWITGSKQSEANILMDHKLSREGLIIKGMEQTSQDVMSGKDLDV